MFCDLSTPHNDGKFNVYDDLKAKLIDRGIPEEEIALTHDANTDTRKQELFNKVGRGQVRVLIGSIQKMGARTNCQDRLIALHDLDCPWRPGDLMQRSGGIIKQGDKNPEVDTYRCVTEGTFDAYLYQLVKNKQRFISQIMISKTPVRSAEDVDETVLFYAGIKALATGNPGIIEKTELDTQVAKLRLLRQNYLSEKYALEDKVIKHHPNEIKRLGNRTEGMKEDIKVFNNNNAPDNSFEKMSIKGTNFTERKEAGEKVIEVCKSMTNPEPLEVGECKGFRIILSFDTIDRKFYTSTKNNSSYKTELGSDPSGNITRIDNVLNGIETRPSSMENNLEDTKKNYESAKKEIEKPSPQEKELRTKSKRLDELNIKLSLNNKNKEIIDDGKDTGDDSQDCKKEYER